MQPLTRWWLRRRHADSEWAALLQPAAADAWVSLDLETTGMNPGQDHILSLAAVPVHDGQVWLSKRFERRVQTDRAFGIDSIRHHRITPQEAGDGEPVAEVVRDFLHWLGGRRLLGYYIDFDAGMLAPHVRSLAGFALPNPLVDLGEEVARRQRQQRPDVPPNLDFVHIATTLGVPIVGRHTALGDATTVGLCWIALQQRGWPAD